MAMIGWLVVFVALVGIEVGTMALTRSRPWDC